MNESKYMRLSVYLCIFLCVLNVRMCVQVRSYVCIFKYLFVVLRHSNSIFQLYHGSDMMYEMRREKPEATL